MEALVKSTSGEDQKIALGSMSHFKGVSRRLRTVSSPGVKIKIEETGEFITIPKKAITLLIDILAGMSEGKSITLVPTDSELSTQQAADMLKISRPHLIKLLENHTIPFKKVGSHRRVLLRDILAYEKGLQNTRQEQLKFLSEQAQELKLGYE